MSNTDHTKMIKQNFRLFYQNFRKQITMSPYYWAMLLQNSTFSQTVTANKHQFSPSYTVCKRLLVLLSKMCFCLRLYGKRDRLPINYLQALLAVLILLFKKNSNNHYKTLEYKLVVILKV